MKKKLVLSKGDIVRYRYKGGWEYARFLNDGTNMLLGGNAADIPTDCVFVVQCVWRGDTLVPRRCVSVDAIRKRAGLYEPNWVTK